MYMLITDRESLAELERWHDLGDGKIAWASVGPWGTCVGLPNGTTRMVVLPDVAPRPIPLRKGRRP